MKSITRVLVAVALIASTTLAPRAARAADTGFDVTLRKRVAAEAVPNSGYHVAFDAQQWKAGETVIIVCDMWDTHTSPDAVTRVVEMAPRMNEVLKRARAAGVFIIHAPSNCMDFYKDHPARKRAMEAPKASRYPPEQDRWCYVIPSEERGVYPLEQTGQDNANDEPEALVKFAEHHKSIGRNPKQPWIRQIETLEIDESRDAITDSGIEIWNLLESRGLRNVILMGVHTNMCVLGRPFGLRRMAAGGKNVVLMRDMTDTFYNSRRWPFVQHYHANGLIAEHIEKFVCPTITSDQILGDGVAFRFKGDTESRKTLVFMIGEDEYDMKTTLPAFYQNHLAQHMIDATFIHAGKDNPNDFPGLEAALKDADALFVGVRRRTPKTEQLDAVKKFIAAGKPIIGMRTASHAFALRGGAPKDGYSTWPEFDHDILGGNYHNHHGKKATATNDANANVWVRDGATDAIIAGAPTGMLGTTSTLYMTTPVASDCKVLMMGKVEGEPPDEPVTWTRTLKTGSRVFYTSLGHAGDFEKPWFTKMLRNGVLWAVGVETPAEPK